MTLPLKFGLPCWNREQVNKVISITAQTSSSSASHFLAVHAPFQQIRDGKLTERTVTEEEIFNDIFSTPRNQVQAFIKGEPGTGKSHLIRWLYERYEHDVREEGIDRDLQRIVLVTRGNGSLKDALGQIVRQLGTEFERHIKSIKGAIDRLSNETAQAMLLAELGLEIDTRWVNERDRKPLDRSLRRLGEALRSNGFGSWMTRKRGVIDQVIRRLTESSDVEDREDFPEFEAGDFDVPAVAFKPNEVSQQVSVFIEDLKEEPETRLLAAKTLNTALRDAIRSLTGLGGNDLLSIFTAIRRQLGSERRLVILIEDVSVTGLDQDIINAFEPRDEAGLCPMISILGITTKAWGQLPDNQTQRATHQFEVGGTRVENWAADSGQVAKFSARYLNAIRSTDDQIEAIAKDRFNGDIGKSNCDDCPWRVECHTSFGYTDFGNDVIVGMFPFNLIAPQVMLQTLTKARYSSQRDLLEHVLMPALNRSFPILESGDFPRSQFFDVQPAPIQYWTAGFLPRYCSGATWGEEAKSRLRFLAQMWMNEPTADALAIALKPMLKPFGLPEFSSKVDVKPSSHPVKNRVRPVSPSTAPPVESTPVDKELERLLALLENWLQGNALKEDSKFRDLLYSFLSNSVEWQDCCELPISEKKRLASGNAFPRIAEQIGRPRGNCFFDFPRDPETWYLLQGLLMRSRSPSKTWCFPHGEVHKRSLSRWLRKHRSRVIKSLQPKNSDIAKESLRPAVQSLALVAYLRDRKRLPKDHAERVASIFESPWSSSNRPVVISPNLKRIVECLEETHESLRDFLIQELGSGQGKAVPKDFINPLPLLEILEEFERNPLFNPPPEEADSGYWKPRFLAVKNLRKGAFQNIPEDLEKEREAILETVKIIDSFVTSAGFENGDLRQRLAQCLEELKSLVELQRGTQHKKGLLELPNESFEQLWKEKLIQDGSVQSTWAVAVGKASNATVESNILNLITFNPEKIMECFESLCIVQKHFDFVYRHLQDEMKSLAPTEKSRSQLLDVLQEIENLSETTTKGTPPNS